MKTTKNIMFMALGGCAVLAYQKYNKPIMRSMKKKINKIKDIKKYEFEDMI